MKLEDNFMPSCNIVIKGDITDFTRVDNLYTSLKREANKMLTGWTIDVEIKYTEKSGDIPKES